MNKSSRNIALALGLGLLGSAGSGFAMPTSFGVDPGAIGKAEGPFTATYIAFTYQATVDQSTSAGTTTVTEDGVAVANSFQHPGLTNPISPLITGLNTSYGLYAVFHESGVATAPVGGGIEGQFDTFSFDIFADINKDTTVTLPDIGGADGSLAVGSTGDDIKVATSTDLVVSEFHVFPGLAGGDFDVIVKMVSTATGLGSGTFFTTPFDLLLSLNVDFNGNNTTLSGFAVPPNEFVDAQIIGSGNLFIPEPSIFFIFSTGLLGLAGIARKRRV